MEVSEVIRLWLSTLAGPIVTALGFIFVYRQLQISGTQAELAGTSTALAAANYKVAEEASQEATRQAVEQQTWKKAEFLAKQVIDFFYDPIVARVIWCLDWQARELELPRNGGNKVLVLQDVAAKSDAEGSAFLRKKYLESNRVVLFARALRPHDEDNAGFTEHEIELRDEFDYFCLRIGQFLLLSKAGLFTYDELEIHLRYILDLISGGKDHVLSTLTDRIAAYVRRYDFEPVDKLIRRRMATRDLEAALNIEQ